MNQLRGAYERSGKKKFLMVMATNNEAMLERRKSIECFYKKLYIYIYSYTLGGSQSILKPPNFIILYDDNSLKLKKYYCLAAAYCRMVGTVWFVVVVLR